MSTIIERPGVFANIPPLEYFADPCPEPSLTNSVATKLLTETPSEAWWVHPRLNTQGTEATDSAVKRMGDVVHQLALGKGRGYAIFDADAWRSDAAKAFKVSAEKRGLTPILATKFKEAEAMAAIVRGMIEKATQGKPYETEVVIAWIESTPHGLVWCRSMIDVWCPELLLALDPKITAYLHTPAAHMVNMGWDRQGAFYKRGLTAIMPEAGGRLKFRDLMVKPKAPYTSLVYGISKSWETSSDIENQRAINLFAKCLANKEWPAYPDETIGEPPSWEEKKRLERAIADGETNDA